MEELAVEGIQQDMTLRIQSDMRKDPPPYMHMDHMDGVHTPEEDSDSQVEEVERGGTHRPAYWHSDWFCSALATLYPATGAAWPI